MQIPELIGILELNLRLMAPNPIFAQELFVWRCEILNYTTKVQMLLFSAILTTFQGR